MLELAGSDHDEAPPQTPAARSKAQAATLWTGQKVPLKRDFTPKENKTHKQSYQRGKPRAANPIATLLVVMFEASTSTFRVTFCGAWLLMANWRCCPSMRSQYRH